MSTLLVALLSLGVLLTATLAFAGWRWQRDTARVRGRLLSAMAGPRSDVSEARLPPPVARYLDVVLPSGAPTIRIAEFGERGRFLTRPRADGWRPFTARHLATIGPCGFLWDARIQAAPGLAVHVRDGFAVGAGMMRASMAGLVPLVDMHDTPEIAAGALMRWLAEAPWYPSALAPGGGVTWQAIDDSTALAMVRDGATSASLEFRFGPDGLVSGVFSAARPRAEGGRSIPTPWRGRWSQYERRAGVLVPTAGEVEWLLPEGPQPYWRGELTDLVYR